MKIRHTPLLAALTVALLGAYAATPAFSATYHDDAVTDTPSQQTQSRAKPAPGEDSMPPSGAAMCIRLDANHDGRISKSEFMASGKSAKDFAKADVAHRGWLTPDQCSRALKG